MPEVPLVLQRDAAECGAACLAMILGFHGTYAPLDELRMEGPLWISSDNRLNDCLGANQLPKARVSYVRNPPKAAVPAMPITVSGDSAPRSSRATATPYFLSSSPETNNQPGFTKRKFGLP
jgi:hypothetical protein